MAKLQQGPPTRLVCSWAPPSQPRGAAVAPPSLWSPHWRAHVGGPQGSYHTWLHSLSLKWQVPRQCRVKGPGKGRQGVDKTKTKGSGGRQGPGSNLVPSATSTHPGAALRPPASPPALQQVEAWDSDTAALEPQGSHCWVTSGDALAFSEPSLPGL